jgi:hypothetical protein
MHCEDGGNVAWSVDECMKSVVLAERELVTSNEHHL